MRVIFFNSPDSSSSQRRTAAVLTTWLGASPMGDQFLFGGVNAHGRQPLQSMSCQSKARGSFAHNGALEGKSGISNCPSAVRVFSLLSRGHMAAATCPRRLSGQEFRRRWPRNASGNLMLLFCGCGGAGGRAKEVCWEIGRSLGQRREVAALFGG